MVRIRTMLSVCVGLIAAILLACSPTPSGATFIVDPDPGGDQLNIDDNNKGADNFDGHVGSHLVTITTVGKVDTGSGAANIKPAKDEILTQLIFTPASDTYFSEFSFRGQLLAEGTIVATVADQLSSPEQLFSFPAIPANVDFARIGILGTLGETIKWVKITSAGFKDFKQVEFGLAPDVLEEVSPVPAPTTLSLLLTGLIGLGWYRRRRHEQGGH